MCKRLSLPLSLLLLLGWVPGAGADVAAPTLNELVNTADRIVRGRLMAGESRKETIALNERGDQGEFLFTYIEVEPLEHLKGAPVSRVVLRLIGGFGQGVNLVDVNAPPLLQDEEVVLFLRAAERAGRAGEQVFQLTHARFSKFRVEVQNGEPVVRRSASLGSLGVPAGPGVGEREIRLDRFRELIQAEAARGLKQ